MERNFHRWVISYTRAPWRPSMPVFVIPLLVGIPVLIGGGYFIIKAFH